MKLSNRVSDTRRSLPRRLLVAGLTSAVAITGLAAAQPQATALPTAQPAAQTSVQASRLDEMKPLIAYGAYWTYYRKAVEPPVTWSFTTNNMGWAAGPTPIGYGASGLRTTIPVGNPAPLSTYFRRTFQIANPDILTQGAQFTTIADDGAIVYVNGKEVGRTRVDDIGAAMMSSTWANGAIDTTTARNQPVTYKIPGAYLRTGANSIAVQVIANYRSTRNISFQGQLTAGGGGPAPAIGRPNPNLKLTWSDEFNGTSLNRNNWTPYNYSTYGDGGGQTECLMDRPKNLTVSNGMLQINAHREATPFKCGSKDTRFPNGRNFTSAHIYSAGKVDFMYGRLEMRAKIPVAQTTSKGLWPAFWLRPVDGGLGEIDIMEALGSRPGDDWNAGIVHQTLHRDYVGTPSLGYNHQLPNGASMANGFHTYAVEWTPTEMKFFVDNALTRTVKASELSWYKEAFTNRKFMIRLNMAVGGRWPGLADSTTQLPVTYAVDYVRLYQ